LSLGGPPLVRAATLAGTLDLFVDELPVAPPSFGGGLDFPGRGNFTPNARSSFDIIAGFGIAFPDSYSPTTCGFSLIAVASSFCVSFLAVRACAQTKVNNRNVRNLRLSLC
jgi:hypothetical protein